MQILPAIIENSYKEVEKKLTLVAPLVNWVQVDVCDGEFVPRTTWARVEELASTPPGLKIDLHIMVRDPRKFAARAATVDCIRRITFHREAIEDMRGVIERIKGSGREAGIALNPETPIESIGPFLPSLDAILVMGVNPGWGGQGFLPQTPARIASFKKIAQGAPVMVGVDGGVHLVSGSAQACVDAGADYLVVGSDIFGSPEPEDIIRALQRLTPYHGNKSQ